MRSLNELLAAVFTASKMPALQKGSALVHPEDALGARAVSMKLCATANCRLAGEAFDL